MTTTNGPPIPKQKVIVPDDVIEAGRIQLNALLRSKKLRKPSQPYDPFEATHIGLSESTTRIYKNLWGEMMRFFYDIGCYQSAMLCDRENCPISPLPFAPMSFSLYLDSRCGKVGEPLMLPKSSIRATNTRGEPMFQIGGWNSPSALQKVHAAVLFLHEQAYTHCCSGPYVQNCEECSQLNDCGILGMESPLNSTNNQPNVVADDDENERLIMDRYQRNLRHSSGFFRSCELHANQPNLRSSGSVLQHKPTKIHFEAWLKIKKKIHVVKGCGQLYPSELRLIRSFLLGRGDPESIQTWVMILMGVRLFLRSDELCNLRVENFVDSYYPKGMSEPIPESGIGALSRCQVVHPNSVKSLSCEIQGKSDPTPVRLALFEDEECPDFDEVRLLLWYVKMFNIQGGYLFPSPDALCTQWQEKCVEPLICEEPIKYNRFLSTMKFLVATVCKRDVTQFLVGTHTLRKTAYLMAIWGALQGLDLGAYAGFAIPFLILTAIVKSARHNSVTNIVTYQRDASTTYELHRAERFNDNNRVSLFKSRWMDPYQHGTAITPFTPLQKPLPQLAKWWYSHCLALGDRPFTRPINILNLALRRCVPPPGLNSLEARLQQLSNSRNPNNTGEVASIMEEFRKICFAQANESNASLLEKNEKLLAESSNGDSGSSLVSTLSSLSQAHEVAARSNKRKRRKKGPPIQISDTSLRNRSGIEKLEFLRSIQNEVLDKTGGELEKLFETHKRWYNRHCVKPCKCLRECFGNQVSLFIEKYGENFSTTGFTCTCDPAQRHQTV